jgi:DNA-binding response OmpR family regulator
MNAQVDSQIKLVAEETNLSNKRPVVLCVDDEEVNLEIIEMHLRKANYDYLSAKSGEEGLDILAKNHVDIILLDRMMPGIDGIKFLKIIKADPKFRNIPVILQTAVTGEKETIVGIEAGAYYYITKPFSSSMLVSIVNSACREKKQSDTLKSEITNLSGVIDNIRSCNFEIQTFEDARKLSSYLSRFAYDPNKYVVGLTSLMINAIEHGNLEVGFEAKNDLLVKGLYDDEIKARLNNPIYKNRKVSVELHKKDKENQYVVIIKDEGKGFSWEEYINFEPTRMTDPNGRGIAMANIMNPGGVEYWSKGNVVLYKMFINKPSGAGEDNF